MAIVKSGIAVGFSGTVGEISFSQHSDGTTRVRQKPKKSSKPPTKKQLSNQQDTAIIGGFVKSIKEFIETGYLLESKELKVNQNNAIVPHIRKDALTGAYPKRKIDFSKVLVSKGAKNPPEDVKVSLSYHGFVFNWNTSLKERNDHHSDQVMLLAYFPQLQKARFLTAGAQRHRGEDLLVLNGIKNGHVAEVYISFVAENRKSISDSVYLGQFNW